MLPGILFLDLAIRFLPGTSFGSVVTSVPDAFFSLFRRVFAPGKDLNILSTVAVLGVVPLNEVVDPYPGITHTVEPISGPLRAILQRSKQRF